MAKKRFFETLPSCYAGKILKIDLTNKTTSALINARASGWSGKRIPIVPVPHDKSPGREFLTGRTTVTGPGRKRSMNSSANSSTYAIP